MTARRRGRTATSLLLCASVGSLRCGCRLDPQPGADRLDERAETERFLEHRLVDPTLLDQAWVAGHEDDGEPRPAYPRHHRQRDAVRLTRRHVEVGEQQVEPMPGLQVAERFEAPGGANDLEVGLPQAPIERVREHLIIFDDEDRAPAHGVLAVPAIFSWSAPTRASRRPPLRRRKAPKSAASTCPRLTA